MSPIFRPGVCIFRVRKVTQGLILSMVFFVVCFFLPFIESFSALIRLNRLVAKNGSLGLYGDFKKLL